MTVRKKDLVAIATALHDLHMAVEAITTDPRFDYAERVLRRKRAFLSAARDIALTLKPHNKGFNQNKFLEVATPGVEELNYTTGVGG